MQKNIKNIITKISTLTLVSIVIFVSSVAPMTAQATSNNDKINICHATHSTQNPWNALQVSENASSHESHHEDFLYEGPVKQNGQPDQSGDEWCASHVPQTTDVCPNIDGTQSTVPEGYVLHGNNCVPVTPTDVCSNIDGTQSTVPEGYTVEGTICTPIQSETDLCSNITGIQTTVPEGYVLEGENCVPVTPTDVCSNIDGTQSTVPEGYTVEGTVCTPVQPPQVCTISSDTQTKITNILIGDNSPSLVDMLAVLVTPTSITNTFWISDVDGSSTDAKWIWSEDPVTDWTVDKYVTFTRTFTVSDVGTSATLNLASDNSYEVFLDGNSIGVNTTEFVFSAPTGDTINIPSLSVGTHTLKFVVKNFAQAGSALNNPGGLLFSLKLNNETCDDDGGNGGGNNNTAPTITLLGDSVITLTIGQTFVDPGANAKDTKDAIDVNYPGVTAGFTVTGLPPVGTLLTTGTYTITYKYTDSDGLDSATVTRTVHVIAGQTACSDGLDNDGDNFTDSQDPNCHADGDNNNGGSYDPNDDDEDAPVVVVDVCPNIDGTQETLPTNTQIVNGICIPIVISEDTDVCANIEGFQIVVPEGMHQDGANCVNNVTPPPTDICSNIEGVQTTVPQGKVQSGNACIDDTNGGGGGNGENNEDDGGLGGGDGILPEDTGGRSGGNRRGGGTNTGAGGIVLGASTECGIYLYDFIKYGAENDPEEVTKLQSFLNEWLGSGLTLNGIYDKKTLEAVNVFQLKYSTDVLLPWVNIGLHPDTKTPTGYVYRTTQRMINNLVCPALNLPLPDLSNER